MLRLARTLERTVKLAAVITAWATVAPIALFSMLQVAGRQLHVGQTGRLPELAIALMFVLVMLLFGHTYLEDGHVRVDVLRRRWSPRALAFIELTGCGLVLLPLSLVLLRYGWHALLDTSKYADAVIWVTKAAGALGPVLLALAGIAVVLRNVAFLCHRSGASAPAPSLETYAG